MMAVFPAGSLTFDLDWMADDEIKIDGSLEFRRCDICPRELSAACITSKETEAATIRFQREDHHTELDYLRSKARIRLMVVL